jgi:SHS2 domain-containing protein
MEIQPMTDQGKDYEFFDHTADVGIRAQASTLEGLFIAMARGLVELVAENSTLKPAMAQPIRVTAPDATALLLAWLQELLFRFSTESFLPVEFTLDEVTETSLRGTIRGETFDPNRHVQGREVKAITRHLLEVQRQPDGWHGQVIVDI